MMGGGFPNAEVRAALTAVLYLDDGRVRAWQKRCRTGGPDELALFDWHGRPGHPIQAQEAELSAAARRRV